MDILNYDDFRKGNDNDSIEGVVWIVDYHKKEATRTYLEGQLLSDEKIGFKVWMGPVFTALTREDYIGRPIFIKGTISKQYNNINITEVFAVDESLYPKELFKKKSPYYIKDLSMSFEEILKLNLTDKGFNLIDNIMGITSNGEIYEKFKTNYAASSHHDNCPYGLMAHTYKCLKILNNFMNLYNWMNTYSADANLSKEDFKDLLYIGIALHDIGKIYEINEDVYFEESFNTHRIIGLETLFAHKQEILDTYNEHFYNLLVSILVGHHDIYGDKAKTLVAYLVHQIDCIDSIFTEAGQVLENKVTTEPSGKRVDFNGSKFFL